MDKVTAYGITQSQRAQAPTTALRIQTAQGTRRTDYCKAISKKILQARDACIHLVLISALLVAAWLIFVMKESDDIASFLRNIGYTRG